MTKLLIVDDNANLRWLMRQALGSAYDIMEADSGREALLILRETAPDLMLLDVVMPGMSGLEVLRAARLSAPETGVIMLTADSGLNVVSEALQGGALGYLMKPFDPEVLRREVARLASTLTLPKGKRQPTAAASPKVRAARRINGPRE